MCAKIQDIDIELFEHVHPYAVAFWQGGFYGEYGHECRPLISTTITGFLESTDFLLF